MEKKKTGISYVFQLAKDERKKLHLGMFLSVISAALSLVPYFVVYKILLMIFQKNISYTEILMWAGIGITSAVLQAILMSFAGILSHTAAFNTMHRIKLKVVNHISKFNFGFFQEHAPGEIKTLLFDDVDRVENFLAHSTLELAQVAVVPVIMFIFMLKLNWMMVLVMLIPMILGLGIPMMLMKNYPDMSTELSEDIADLNASANEFIKAIPVIKMYHLTAEKFEQYRNSLNAYIACWKKMCMSSCYPLSITLVVFDSAILFTLPFGGYFFLRNSLSATSYLLFIMLTMCFFVSFLNMVTIFMQSMELGSGLDNIKKIMDMDELKDGTKIINKNECMKIDFKDVTFSYGDEETKNKALQHINLSLKPNTINAFVGASGWGKTKYIGAYEIKSHAGNKEMKFPDDVLKINENSYGYVSGLHYWFYWIDIILYGGKDYYFEVDCPGRDGFACKLIGNQDKIISNNIGMAKWTLSSKCKDWYTKKLGFSIMKQYIIYLDQSYINMLYYSLLDLEFRKEVKGRIENIIKGALKTAGIIIVGAINDKVGIAVSIVDFLANILDSSEMHILCEQLLINIDSEYIKLVIYEKDSHLATIRGDGVDKRIVVSAWTDGNTALGEKYLWGEIQMYERLGIMNELQEGKKNVDDVIINQGSIEQ